MSSEQIEIVLMVLSPNRFHDPMVAAIGDVWVTQDYGGIAAILQDNWEEHDRMLLPGIPRLGRIKELRDKGGFI
jgi:hypothetical protein